MEGSLSGPDYARVPRESSATPLPAPPFRMWASCLASRAPPP